ncbi:MAG TPA: helix-turn-helix transcriptional regulator [Planctomycetota bacterium]|nr:helix-turn-helix transcriptional regulator [Planctomycetota bacterium]
MPGNPKFGKLIRRLREDRKKTDSKYSLRQFAEAVGLSATFVSKMETGEYAPPSPEKIKNMAEVLGTDPDELLALAGKIDPELGEIILEKPKSLPNLLRAVRGMSEEELRNLIKAAGRK